MTANSERAKARNTVRARCGANRYVVKPAIIGNTITKNPGSNTKMKVDILE